MLNPDTDNLKLKHVSIGGASKILGVSIDTLRRWGKRGKIKIYRSPGGHRYFNLDDLNALFDSKYERDEPSQKSDVTIEKPKIPQPENYQSKNLPDSVKNTEAINTNELPDFISLKEKEETVKVDEDINSKSINSVEDNIPLSIQPTLTNNEYQPPSAAISQDDLKQKLDVIFPNKNERKPKGFIFLVIAFVIFIIIDLVLFLKWYSSLRIISPLQ